LTAVANRPEINVSASEGSKIHAPIAAIALRIEAYPVRDVGAGRPLMRASRHAIAP